MFRTQSLPKARTDGVLVEQVGDETVVYDLESKDVHCLSPLAAVIFERCDGRTTPAEAARLVAERLGEPVAEEQVSAAVEQLQERSLLELPPVVMQDGGISRRQMMKRSAIAGAAALATPLITSIAAPTAAMALTGIPTGCTGCGKNSDCVSNHCCQDVAGKSCNQTCCVGANNSCHLVDPTCTSNCQCTVDLLNCNVLQCPPGSQKCCTQI